MSYGKINTLKQRKCIACLTVVSTWKSQQHKSVRNVLTVLQLIVISLHGTCTVCMCVIYL